MKKLTILLADAAGNGYDFRAKIMPQTMIQWISTQKVEKISKEENDKLFDNVSTSFSIFFFVLYTR